MWTAARNDLRIGARYIPVWTVAGIFAFSQDRAQKAFSHISSPWGPDFAAWMTGMYVWALLTPAVVRLSRRFPLERKTWRRRIPLHLLFSVLFSVGELAAHGAILYWLGLFPPVTNSFTATFLMLLGVASQQNVITYWVIVGVNHGFRLYRQYEEREKEALRLKLSSSELKTELVRARLSALKAQLQPHFLFNTLNAIMVLVRQQKTADAERTLARLSDLLRSVLDDVEAQEVPLRQELEHLELYLSIEQVRFGDRLQVTQSADPSVLDAAFPHMGLQPLAENAIRHGIGRRSTAGRIEISAARVNGKLEVRISDDGPGLGTAPSGGAAGIGLTNTRTRLEQLYGNSAELRLENGPRGGAVATVILPFRLMPSRAGLEVVEAHAIDRAGS